MPDPAHGAFIREAARLVAAHCKLPDPRPQGMLDKAGRWFSSWLRSRNHLSGEQCEDFFINQAAESHHLPRRHRDWITHRDDFEEILKRADTLAQRGIGKCQVRDFVDTKDEPLEYQGYRAKNGQCAVRRVPR